MVYGMNDKAKILKQLAEECSAYRFSMSGKVQFSEVDFFGVVHNLRYFYWLEYARTEYLSNLLPELNPNKIIRNYTFMSVHAEIDYFNPARYGDEYLVLTKISNIKNSSITFQNIIRLKDGTILAKASAILVNFDSATFKSERIPDLLRERLRKFEEENVELN